MIKKKFLSADGNIVIINSKENVQINSDKVTMMDERDDCFFWKRFNKI